ncbi:MAG: hypothetical protein KY475_13240 [Planctomycetes bacterium]|nr:hypothetical protein [Planctomycetota bacterium]
MNDSPQTWRGVIRGKTIELDDSPGLPEGQQVVVLVRAAEPLGTPGEGLRRSFGGWAESADDLDEYLEWSRAQRKQGRREIDP